MKFKNCPLMFASILLDSLTRRLGGNRRTQSLSLSVLTGSEFKLQLAVPSHKAIGDDGKNKLKLEI